MVFNSFHFVVFFVVVYSLYRLLPHRQQNWLLLVASYYFYGSWDWRFLGLLAASTLVDYYCGLYIDRQAQPARRKIAVAASLTFNLSMLGFFKYFNFFADSLQRMLHGFGFQADYVTLNILLPIGISFYTFITMSYVIDVYRREVPACRSLPDFALFVSYFPHLVAGPILRADVLLPQIQSPRQVRGSQIRDGLWLILFGAFKKIFVADNLAHIADAIFNGGAASPAQVLIGTYAFAFQIYGDFSGYSDIARGTSLLMGIELNLNFRFPYFVRSAPEFWRHWHISLSTWLRDYLYIPLGGNRRGPMRTKVNLALTMILGGLWHGAAWTYVLWGVYQGVLLMAFRTADELLASRPWRWLSSPVAQVIGIILMFHLTCYGWLIFRANSVGQIWQMTSSLFGISSAAASGVGLQAVQLTFYAAPLLILHAYEAWRADVMALPKIAVPLRYALCLALFYLTAFFGEFGGAQFIYFRF